MYAVGASPSGTTPGWAVERLRGYRRLLCLVADDSHGECMSRLLFGAAKENVHEGHSEFPQAAGVKKARYRLGSAHHYQDGIYCASLDRHGDPYCKSVSVAN